MSNHGIAVFPVPGSQNTVPGGRDDDIKGMHPVGKIHFRG